MICEALYLLVRGIFIRKVYIFLKTINAENLKTHGKYSVFGLLKNFFEKF